MWTICKNIVRLGLTLNLGTYTLDDWTSDYVRVLFNLRTMIGVSVLKILSSSLKCIYYDFFFRYLIHNM